MIINKLEYEAYGKLRNQEIILKPGINIIYGKNESGKSTIFNSIQSLLYGFSPANRRQHPYVNWVTDEAVFRADIIINEASYHVMRELKHTPKTRILEKVTQGVDIGRNEALPWVKEISASLYTSVFHLTSEDLMSLETQSWEQIQEKLVFNYGIDYLRKTSEVLAVIDNDLKQLWRSDRRGNPKIATLEQEIRTLERERLQYEKLYEQLAILDREAQSFKETIVKYEEERRSSQEMYQEIYAMLPVKHKLEKIEMLKNEIIHDTFFRQMPEDLLQQFQLAKERLETIRGDAHDLEEALIHQSNKMEAMTPYEQLLLENGNEIQLAEKNVEAYERLTMEIERLSMMLSTQYDAVEASIFKLFGYVDQDLINALKKVNPTEIQTMFYRLMDMKQKNEIESMRRWDKVNTKRKSNLLLMLVALMSMGIGFIYPLLQMAKWLGFILFGAVISDWLRFKKEVPLPFDEASFIEKIRQQLPNVTLPEFIWDDATHAFSVQLKQICDQFYEIDHQSDKLQKNISQRTREEDALKKVNMQLGALETEDALTFYRQIQIKWKACQDHALSLEKLQEKYQENQKRSELVKVKYREALAEFTQIENQFSKLGSGDLEKGLQIFKKNKEVQNVMRVYEEEMLSHIDLVEAIRHYKSPEKISASYIEFLEQEKIIQEKELQRAYIGKTQCEEKIEQIKKENRLEDIDGQILMLKDLREQSLEKRDVLMALKSILSHADEVYRKEHQPDIVRRVSALMNIITDGKYEDVFISEGFELQFLIEGTLYPISKAFSKGTLNQLFLAYRLAVIEMLSEGREKLPIVLDEAFINWDDHRLLKTFDVLEALSLQHQIIIFTCHPMPMDIKSCHHINLSDWDNDNMLK